MNAQKNCVFVEEFVFLLLTNINLRKSHANKIDIQTFRENPNITNNISFLSASRGKYN